MPFSSNSRILFDYTDNAQTMRPTHILAQETHKAGSAAQFKGCSVCFELPDPVYFGCGAYYSVSKAQKDPIPCFRGVKITVQSTKKRNSVLSGAKIEVESTKSVIFVLSAYNMS